MNVKAVAAIALTLAIAAPIGLGYMLNIDTVEQSSLVEKDSTNISDLINNSTQSVYTPYTGVENNKNVTINGAISQPNYVTTGSTYTSIPIIGNIAPYTWNVTQTNSNPIPEEFGPLWEFTVSNDYISVLTYKNSHGNTVWTSFAQTAPAVMETIKKTDTYYYFGAGDNIGVPVSEVNDLKISFRSLPPPITVQRQGITGYAYPQSGWYSPDTPGGNDLAYWFNNQNNSGITLTVNLVERSITKLSFNTLYQANAIEIEKESSGNVVVRTYGTENGVYGVIAENDLGNYQYIRMIKTTDGVTVGGLSSWPSMTDKNVTMYNSVVMPLGSPYFSRIYFTDDAINTGANIYRVDETQIKSGTYPAVSNAVIDPTNINPTITNSQLKISKVGIFGSSITFGGQTYDVTNGRISVNNRTVQVDGATFRSVTDDGVTWSNYINNYKVSDTASLSTLSLNGVWSAIYTLSTLDVETKQVTSWIPGHFALDMSGFAVMGIVTCAALTVGLGLYGKRSGTKMLWLMMITGGAGLIFMFMI